MKTLYRYRSGSVTSFSVVLLVVLTAAARGAPPEQGRDQGAHASAEAPQRSGGSYQLRRSIADVVPGPYSGEEDDQAPLVRTTGTIFDGPDFNDVGTENGGWLAIPPDPIGAAGVDRVIAVVNKIIEARTKTGILLWRDSLEDFFSPLAPAPPPGGGPPLFDPKVVYDHHEHRFVVVALEKVEVGSNPNAGNISRILLAVSKHAAPTTATSANWHYHAIDGKEVISGVDCWADYPGFEVDEEAVYLTMNMYEFDGGADRYAMRLWIVDKGVAGGFYGGGAAAVTKHDPPGAVGRNPSTAMPAEVYGAGGVGPGIGTFLVVYSGTTWGGPGADEGVSVYRVDNPLGAVGFTRVSVRIDDIENVGGVYGWPNLPDAPQSGTGADIEVNDRRALDAVWRNDRLWLTTTINPNSGPDAGQTTAHWIRLDTSSWPPTLDDQGDIGGEDIHGGGDVYTFFPSLAVNNAGDAVFGFAASSPNIYAGAYVTGREAGDAAGTVQASETVRAGLDYYIRTFGGSRNRWGDYTGASLDPTDDDLFWVFNEYAKTRGTVINGEDGRWATAWASYTFAGPTLNPLDLPSNTVHHARKHRYISVDATTNLPNDVSIKVEIAEMNRCQGDPRRSCINNNDCPTVCDLAPDTHSCSNGSSPICPDVNGNPGGLCIKTGPCGPHPNVGLSWFVQEPQTRGAASPNGMSDEEDYYARVEPPPAAGGPPVYGSDWKDECEDAVQIPGWTGGCSTLHIGDCEIVPGVVYNVYACHPVAGDPCSIPLQVETTRRPNGAAHYGDVAGGVTGALVFEPPDGFVNVKDVTAYKKTVMNWGTTNLPQAHPTWVDLHGPGPGIPPQYILGVTDLTMILRAWVNVWPFENTIGGLAPGDCP